MGAHSVAGPPPTIQGGCTHHPDDRDAVVQQRNQAGPQWNSTHKVLGAVDRIDHPLPALEYRRSTLFFAEDRIAGPLARQYRTDIGLDRLIGVGDRGEVGFGVDAQIQCAESGHGDLVGTGGEG